MTDRENSVGISVIPGNGRDVVRQNNFTNPLGRIGSNFSAAATMQQRESLASYFLSEEGIIDWNVSVE